MLKITVRHLPLFLFCCISHLWNFKVTLTVSQFPMATLLLMHMDCSSVAHVAWKSLGRQLQPGYSVSRWHGSNAVSAK